MAQFKSYRGRVFHNVFQELNEESCYWAGYLYGDGCVCHRKDGVHMVQLDSKDREIIEAFSRFVSGGVERVLTCEGKLGTWYRVMVSSKKMVADLEKFGIVPRKSLAKEYKVVEMCELLKHYVRGCLDSDGTLGLYGRPGRLKESSSVRMFGTRAFCNFLGSVLMKLGYRVTVMANHSVFRVTVFEESKKKFLSWLYENGFQALSRKRELAFRILKG